MTDVVCASSMCAFDAVFNKTVTVLCSSMINISFETMLVEFSTMALSESDEQVT